MSVSAIIVAAGSGKRMGSDIPKQFLDLQGRPLLAYSLLAFASLPSINELIVLVPEGWENRCRREVIEKFGIRKVSHVLAGGIQRQDSVYRGLKKVQRGAQIIVIHDGARPLVENGMIEESIKVAQLHGAGLVAIPVSDTLKQGSKQGIVRKTLKRENFWLAQTPQTFKRKIILKAYQMALGDGFYGTDDASLVERAGFAVHVVPGSPKNIKVTTPEDLQMAEFLLREGRLNVTR